MKTHTHKDKTAAQDREKFSDKYLVIIMNQTFFNPSSQTHSNNSSAICDIST